MTEAWHNHHQRDVRLVEIIQQQAQELDLQVIMNDGQQSLGEIAGQVEAQFRTHLVG